MFKRRFRFTDPLIATIVGLAACALYLRTLAPGLLWGDSAEFQFAAWLGGFAHPTGYPLYLMAGWLWAHLIPFGDPAWRINLFSAAWGGVAVALVYGVAVRILWRSRSGIEASAGHSGPRTQPAEASTPDDHSRAEAVRKPSLGLAGLAVDRLLALAAALVFAVTPTFWSQAVVAEVYTLHAAFVAAILLAALAWADRPGWPRLYLLAGLVGLSLAHHRTTLLLLPGLVIFLVCSTHFSALKRSLRTNFGINGRLARHLFGLSALFLAPLLLYAYIPLVAPRTPYFTVTLGPGQELPLYEPTLRGFLAHISGSVFGSALGAPRGPWLAELVGRLTGELTWPGVALGIVGVAWLAWRDRRALALTGLIFVTTVGFNAIYGIGDIHVFYIPAYLTWAIWLAAGAGALGQGLVATIFGGARPRPSASAVAMAMPVLLVLAGWLLMANFARVDRSADRTASAAWDTILAQPLPQGALLITNDRDEMVPQWYLRYVEGRRADLTGLFPLIQPGPPWSDVAAVTEQALAGGRPVYLIKPMPGLEVKFDLRPVPGGAADGLGALVRVAGLAAQGQLAQASGAVFGERLRLVAYEARPPTVIAGQTVQVILEWAPRAALEHDYTTFVQLLNAEDAVVGQSDHRPGGVYYPTSLWRVGDRLRDSHQIAVAADPGPGPYALLVGLYRLTPDLQHLGAPQRIGELAAP